MANLFDEIRRKELYGPGRNQYAEQLRKTLNKSHVLQAGEYNYSQKSLGEGVWKTTHSSDFSKGLAKQVEAKQEPTDKTGKPKVKIQQLDTHFKLGNESGLDVPTKTYQISATQDDFDPKNADRPNVLGADPTVNWPDMAPQYRLDRNIGSTDYRDTYTQKGLLDNHRGRHDPMFPRINTCKVHLPVSKSDKKAEVNVVLGSDGQCYETETGRAYSRSAPAGGRILSLAEEAQHEIDVKEDLRQRMAQAREVTHMMREMDRKSHVFRRGDYNNAKQESGSIFNLDYGKSGKTGITGRLSAPAYVATKRSRKKLATENASDDEEEINVQDPDIPKDDGLFPKIPKLINFCLETAVPEKVAAGEVGRKDNLKAHFQFGTDDEKKGSVYYKDFTNAASKTVQKPTIVSAPVDSEVLQNDPDQGQGLKKSTTSIEFGSKTFDMAVRANTHLEHAAVKNMARRHGNNIILSYDQNRHKDDRQASLSHTSYTGPPESFKAMEANKAPIPTYNYLETDVALPHPVDKDKKSEAKTQFRGYMMDGAYSKERRKQKDEQTKSRLDHGRSTHFIFGYDGPNYQSEQKSKYLGNPKNDDSVPPAGKIETIPDFKINHHNISENTQDMRANPYRVSIMESLEARHRAVSRALPALAPHQASTMMNDYQTLKQRMFTPAQEVVLTQNDKLDAKPIANSHLFHTDTSGNSNLETTTMADFIKPVTMSGRKYLAAR